MQSLSKLTILLSIFMLLPICNSIGNINKTSTINQETVVYSFDGIGDGTQPLAGLIQASDGNFYGTTYLGGYPGYGTVFKITPQGVKTTLYNFTGNNGIYPMARLIQGSDGNLYGTTTGGGSGSDGSGYGIVYKVTPQGQGTVLYKFAGGTDGATPYAGLIQAKDGNFYGTTVYGGNNAGGTVFKITPQGVKTTLYNFESGPDGAYPWAGLVQGSDGNFYGTTSNGGGKGYGTVFQITPQGQEIVLYRFNGGTDGATPYAGLIQAKDGNFYGTTVYGGGGNCNYDSIIGCGTVFRITPQGQETVLHSFAGGTDGYYPLAALIQASDGNFYSTAVFGGSWGYGTVFKITPQGQETVLYSFGLLYRNYDGKYPQAGLIQASDGNFYGTTRWGGYLYPPIINVGTVFKITLQ